jgi:hypothetical protein
MNDSDHEINGRVFLKKIRLVNWDKETTQVFKEEFNEFCTNKESTLETNMNYIAEKNQYEESSNWTKQEKEARLHMQ